VTDLPTGAVSTPILFRLPTSEFCIIELIGVSTMGSNNLDFHLAFHLGRFHEIADASIEFHIISNDSGFNGLVNYLKKIGRKCKKVSIKTVIKPKKNQMPLSEFASLVVKRLEQLDGRKRPRKRSKLINWIKSQRNGFSGTFKPEGVYSELIAANLINEERSNIGYNLKRYLVQKYIR
jgi:hypothetical protein